MFKKRKLSIIIAVVLVLIAAVSVWYIFYGGKVADQSSNTGSSQPEPTLTPNKDLITMIESSGQLSNFSKLITASGVKFTLQTVGQNYLVLAPTNDGFKSLPSGYFDSLLNADKQSTAQNISKYHVALMPTTDLTDGQKLKTLEGQEVIVRITSGKYSFTDAKGNVANVANDAQKASNGTIYVINSILLPQ